MKSVESVKHVVGGSVLLLCVASGWAAAPKVVTTVPANGAGDVDPKLKEITVVFDQAMTMGQQYSWVGGGPAFPKTRGTPKWTDARTCVLPVRLQPNHAYWLSINSNQFKNFVSKGGQPAVPYPISFRTAGGKKKPKLTPAQNDRAIKELREAIDTKYSYRDLRQLDWDKLFAEHSGNMRRATSERGFAEAAARLLGNAKDIHIWLTTDGGTVGTFRREVTPNFNAGVVEKTVPGWQKRSAVVRVGRFEDDIGYVLIASWNRKHTGAIQQASRALVRFRDTRALIIDVRPNSGGAEPLAQDFAGRFIDKPVVYAKHVYRDAGAAGGFGKTHERKLDPVTKGPQYRGTTVVLMGPGNMSSCEAFLLMMKRVPHCKLIGSKSYGSSGNPKPTALANGVTVYLPSWKAMTPDGEVFETKGIKPDIEVNAPPEQFKESDPVLEAALKYLRSP